MKMENTKPDISAVIPAYNEESGIGPVIDSLNSVLAKTAGNYEIIVIDDGSSDHTAEVARKHPAKVIRHPNNRGYGRALLTGFSAAKYDWILMIDGDGSYPPEEALKLMPNLPDFDMVIGARQGAFFWGSPFKTLLRWIYLSIARFVAGESIPDANSGLRIVRKKTFDNSMPFVCLGYSFTTTMTLSMLKAGSFVQFVPINFVERKGSSKVRYLRDTLRTLQIMTQVMIYYNPIKLTATLIVFLSPISVLPAFYLFISGKQLAAAIVFIGALSISIIIFFLGCIMELLHPNKKIFAGTADNE